MMEKGKSSTAPADTASVNVHRNNLEEKRGVSPAIGEAGNAAVIRNE